MFSFSQFLFALLLALRTNRAPVAMSGLNHAPQSGIKLDAS